MAGARRTRRDRAALPVGVDATKDPSLRDTLYVEELIGQETISTMPEDTIRAFQDHGRVESQRSNPASRTRGTCSTSSTPPDFDYDDVVATLEREGIEKFVAWVNQLLKGIADKRHQLAAAA